MTNLPTEPMFFGTEDLDTLFKQCELRNKGIAFFVLQVPRGMKAKDANFPVPQLEDLHEGFLDWSDDPALILDKSFDATRHLFGLISEGIVIMGIVGDAPAIYNWAQDWLNKTSANPAFKAWMVNAVWIPHTDFNLFGDPADESETEDQSAPVDLDNQAELEQLVYGDLDKEELEKLAEIEPTDEEQADLEAIAKRQRDSGVLT